MPVKCVLENIQQHLQNLESIETSSEVAEHETGFLSARESNTKMLLAQYIQSRMVGSLSVEDARQKTVDLLMGKLEDESPSTLLKILTQLSEIGQNDLSLVLGTPSPNQKGGSPLSLSINNTLQTQNTNNPSQSVGGAGESKALKSLAKIHQFLVSEKRTADKEIEVNAEDIEMIPKTRKTS